MLYELENISPETVGGGHFVAGNATVIGRVRLQAQSSVWFQVVIRGDNELIDIGARSNVQDASVLHTDPGYPLTIGADVTIGHCVMLHGSTIGDGSLIGIGSTILNGATIGAQSIVGAHALVTEGKSFPERSLILGAPARVVRTLSDAEVAANLQSAAHYVENAARYRTGFSPL